MLLPCSAVPAALLCRVTVQGTPGPAGGNGVPAVTSRQVSVSIHEEGGSRAAP